jgi:small-conductance mechanosensitive channel
VPRLPQPRLLATTVALALLLAASPARPVDLAEDRQAPAHAPVSVRGEAIFQVQAPTGQLPVPERAARIQERLEAAVRAGRTGDEVRVEARTGGADVYAGPEFVFSVWDEDAARAATPLATLTAERVKALKAALDAAAQETQPASLVRSGAKVAGATLALVLFLVVLRRLGRLARYRTARLAHRRMRLLRRSRVPGLSALRVGKLIRGAIRLVGAVAAVIAVAAWLEFTLVQVPWTRAAARAGGRFVVDAVGGLLGSIVDYAPNAFYIVLLVLLTRLVLRVISAAFRELEVGRVSLPGFHADWARPTFNLVRLMVIALAAVVIFPYLPGSGSPAFQSVSIFVGVLVSLGSTSAVANVVAGVILTYMRPFLVGDRIRCGDVEGMVLVKGFLAVRLRTDWNEVVILPNATVLSGHVVNYSAMAQGAGLLVRTAVTIGYATPWQQVHGLLVAAAEGTEGLERTPPPFVLQTGLDDFYVRYQVTATCRAPERLPHVLGALHQRIQDEFARAGVEIMSPHVTMLRDGHEIAFPAAHHPPGAVPGRLRVETAVAPPPAPAAKQGA